MYKKYDIFHLKTPIEGAAIPVGSRGVVLEVYGGDPNFYEVEFPDDRGSNLSGTTTFTIAESQMAHVDQSSLGISGRPNEWGRRKFMRDAATENRWINLKCGGAVLMNNGVPVTVTDKGRWELDETQILKDAAEATCCKLEWAELSRSKRWKSSSFNWFIFAKRNWSMAKILRCACEACGNEKGITYIDVKDQRLWLGNLCKRTPEDIET